jgi:flagellar basal body-associated protein FliL
MKMKTWLKILLIVVVVILVVAFIGIMIFTRGKAKDFAHNT